MIFTCDFCNKEFDKPPAMVLRNKTKCCSVECAKKLIASQRITNICAHCGREFKVKKSHSYQKCCSNLCAKEYRSLHDINNKPIVLDGKLLCIRCNEYKNYDEFYDTDHNSKYSKRNNKFKYCKICHQIVGLEQYIKRKNSIEGTLKEIIKRTKSSCKRKGMQFEIDIEFLLSLYKKQDGRCIISGNILEASTYYNHSAVSVDRIDSTKGYTKDNVQLVCWVVNQMKNNLSKEDLLYWCSRITKNNNYEDKEELD